MLLMAYFRQITAIANETGKNHWDYNSVIPITMQSANEPENH